MNEIKIKNEFSEVDLMKDNSITKIVTDIIKKIDFTQGKMMFILSYLEIRIKEETQEKFVNNKLINFYKTLKEEIFSIYNSRLENRLHIESEGKIKTSLSLKTTTPKLSEWYINFSMPINSILASITGQENLITLE